jgi:hypothetical protein
MGYLETVNRVMSGSFDGASDDERRTAVKEHLNKAFEAGVLTDEEFQRKKEEALAGS